MRKLEQRVARLEAEKLDRSWNSGTPAECTAAFGYTLEQAVAGFGSFPAFCYGVMVRPTEHKLFWRD